MSPDSLQLPPSLPSGLTPSQAWIIDQVREATSHVQHALSTVDCADFHMDSARYVTAALAATDPADRQCVREHFFRVSGNVPLESGTAATHIALALLITLGDAPACVSREAVWHITRQLWQFDPKPIPALADVLREAPPQLAVSVCLHILTGEDCMVNTPSLQAQAIALMATITGA